MDVVVAIVKVMGLILAILLGILLSLCVLALAVPIQYAVDVRRESADSFDKGWNGRFRVSWPLRIWSVTVRYEGEWDVKVRLLGIRLFRRGLLRPKGGASGGKAAKKRKRAKPREDADRVKGCDVQGSVAEPPRLEEGGDGAAYEGIGNKRQGIWTSLRRAFRRVWHNIKRFFEGVKEFFRTFGAMRERGKRIWNFIRNKENKAAFKAIKKCMLRLWRHVRPRRFKAKVRMGFDDPRNTGLALGAISLLYARMEGGFQVEPDFEGEALEGFLYVKGRISLLVMLVIVASLFMDKGVREMMRRARELQNIGAAAPTK